MARGKKSRPASALVGRPSHLVIVTHPGQKGIELFSAHHTEEEAIAMHARLAELLAKTGSLVHLVEVPVVEGLVKSEKKPEPQSLGVVVTEVNVGQKVLQSPYRSQTDAEFQEETRQLLKGNGPRDGHRDDKYVGAFS